MHYHIQVNGIPCSSPSFTSLAPAVEEMEAWEQLFPLAGIVVISVDGSGLESVKVAAQSKTLTRPIFDEVITLDADFNVTSREWVQVNQ